MVKIEKGCERYYIQCRSCDSVLSFIKNDVYRKGECYCISCPECEEDVIIIRDGSTYQVFCKGSLEEVE